MKIVLNPRYAGLKDKITRLPARFEQEGTVIINNRNVVKIMDVEGMKLNVKSFKKPHFINQFAYAYVRKSKAMRSFEYATLLEKLGVGTPEPIAYIEFRNPWGLTRSYYISRQVEYDWLFRDLITVHPEDMENMLKQFTRFTHNFHTHGIYFLDHSPGNTLIEKLADGKYAFYLVDLNRIKMMDISPMEGLRNFHKLNATDEMIEIIATEYARLTKSDAGEMVRLLKEWTHAHDEKVRKYRKMRGWDQGKRVKTLLP